MLHFMKGFIFLCAIILLLIPGGIVGNVYFVFSSSFQSAGATLEAPDFAVAGSCSGQSREEISEIRDVNGHF